MESLYVFVAAVDKDGLLSLFEFVAAGGNGLGSLLFEFVAADLLEKNESPSSIDRRLFPKVGTTIDASYCV